MKRVCGDLAGSGRFTEKGPGGKRSEGPVSSVK